MTTKYFVAQTDLYVAPFVCAHRAGALVAEDAVTANGWEDSVKAATSAVASAADAK